MPNAYAKSLAGGLSDEFWTSLEDGTFRVPRCDACGTYRFPPTSMCPACHAIAFAWTPVSGTATLWSWTIVHRSPKPQFEELVPYCLGVALLTEGPLVLGQIDTTVLGATKPAVGLPLSLVVDTAVGTTPPRYHFVVTEAPAP